MTGRCIIVGAGELDPERLLSENADYIIAADGGYNCIKKAGLEPNLILGDFDSLGVVPTGDNVLTVPAEKDDTDTLLAVKKAMELGFKDIAIYGGTGGRFDHTVANLQTLLYMAEAGVKNLLVGADYDCTVIKNSQICFSSDNTGYLSVFAIGGQARGVTERGLRYHLQDAVLQPDFPIGVSNEFIGSNSEISVSDGALLIIHQR